jgi:hypothetical protein
VTAPMNRREALKTATVFVGSALIASNGLLIACESGAREPGRVLDRDDQNLVEDIADTLLPTTTASPGAKAAGVGATVNLILSDCYSVKDQQRVVNGLKTFRDACRQRQGSDFSSLSRAQRESFLRDVDAEARKASDAHYFPLLRELAEGAYWSSETGLTRALRYVMVPGRYDGCVPLQPGQPAWG